MSDLTTLAFSFLLRPSLSDLPPLPNSEEEVFDDNLNNFCFQRMKKSPTQEDNDFLESYRITFLTLKALGCPIQGNPPILEILGRPTCQLLPNKEEQLDQLEYYKRHWQKYSDELEISRKIVDGDNLPTTLRYGFIPPISDESLNKLRTTSDSRLPVPPAEPPPQKATKFCPIAQPRTSP